jgi:magnesium transporter
MNPDSATDAALEDSLSRTYIFDYPESAAHELETMPVDDVAAILGEQPVHGLVHIWGYLPPGLAQGVLLKLPDERISQLLAALEAGPAAALLHRLEPEDRERLLSLLDTGSARELRELLAYPADSAGGMMDTRVNAVNEAVTVADALKQLRNQGIDALGHLFLLDNRQRLTGRVDIRRLAMAGPETPLADVSRPARARVNGLDPVEDVLAVSHQYNVENLPVVDPHQRLLGVIQQSRLMEAVQEDLVADMATMVGAGKEERALSSSWLAVRKRLPWLHINLVTAFLAAAVVGLFESTIAQFTALAVLLPIAAGQSGNTGAQALAVTMRGLTLREITLGHWWRVAAKEAGAGLINGLAIAVTCGLGVYLWSGNNGLALIIALAMVISMTIAGVSGALVPIVLKRFGQDPAQSSSIFLTTITDIAGFMSFLGIATLLAGMLI